MSPKGSGVHSPTNFFARSSLISMKKRFSSVDHERKYMESITSSSQGADTGGSQDKEPQQMRDMRESRILFWAFIYWGLPGIMFGVLATAFPIVYMLMPVQES